MLVKARNEPLNNPKEGVALPSEIGSEAVRSTGWGGGHDAKEDDVKFAGVGAVAIPTIECAHVCFTAQVKISA